MRNVSLRYNADFEMVTETCCVCGVLFAMTQQLNNRFRDHPDEGFHCPSGHKQFYTKGKSRAEMESALKAAEARARVAENAADVEREKARKARAKLARVSKGVCPDCNRSFSDLKRHMEAKHAS